MKKTCLISSFIILIILLINTNNSFVISAQFNDYETFLKCTKELVPDNNKICNVEGFMMMKDAAIFGLDSGSIYFFKPLGSRICIAVFLGRGNFILTPPTWIEQNQLERFYGNKTFQDEFESMTIIFTDSTYYQISSEIPLQNGVVPDKVKNIFSASLKGITDKKSKQISTTVSKALLESNLDGYFYAMINTDNNGTLGFEINPYNNEEVQFQRSVYVGANFNDYSEAICQFHRSEDYANKTIEELESENQDEISLYKYIMDIKIASNLDFSASTEVQFIARKSGDEWLGFALGTKIELKSVITKNNEQLSYYKGEESPFVWVKLNKPLKSGDTSSIIFKYEGDIINRVTYTIQEYGITVDMTTIERFAQWYPDYGFWAFLKYFDMTFHYPDNYKLSASGTKVSENIKDNIITSRWIPEDASAHVGFNIGPFKIKEVKSDDIPYMKVMASNTKQIDAVATEMETSYRFYKNFYGEIPPKEMYATEIPWGHGQAFPGFLHLSSGAFLAGENTGSISSFVAHEMAHQWWGLGVDTKTYHDAWISEAFAEYSSLMFIQMYLKDNKKFFDQLNFHKRDLLSIRSSFIFGKGKEPGPISLGPRNSTSTTAEDYFEVIYKKGAWVLHMLRNLLLDLNTMKEDLFIGVLKDFYNKYKGGLASTYDFQKHIESYIGMDMTWFFNQWVHSSKIPKYTFAYKTESINDGKFKVRCKIKQENVPENFQMIIPIKIDYGDGKLSRMRIVMKGRATEFDLPLLSMKPKNIYFNDLESVLCEWENEDYEDF